MSQTTGPALNRDDDVALIDKFEVNRLFHSPSKAGINVLLPQRSIMGLWFIVKARIDTAIQMGRVLRVDVSRNGDNWN